MENPNNNKKSDLISVIIPVFNGEAYLPEFLDSLMHQTYENFEVIFGYERKTTDSSLNVLKEFQESVSGKHTVIIDEGTDSGAGGGRNRGLLRASGTYVIFSDADDYLAPQYLEYLHEAFVLHPETSVSTCGCIMFHNGDRTEDVLRTAEATSRHEIHLYTKKEMLNYFFRMSLQVNDVLPSPACWTFMVKRETLLSLNHTFIDSSVKKGVIEDVIWVLKLLCSVDTIANTTKILYLYRVYGYSSLGSVSTIGLLRSLDATCDYLKSTLDVLKPEFSPELLRRVFLVFIVIRGIVTADTYEEWIEFLKEAFNVPEDDTELKSARMVSANPASEVDNLLVEVFNRNKHWCYVLVRHWYAALARRWKLYPVLATQLPLKTDEEIQIARELEKLYPEYLKE